MTTPADTGPRRDPDPDRVADRIGESAARKARARARGERSVWFGLGMFGLVGWAVAIPTLAGVALGVWLDAHVGGRISWTLALLLAGVALGCLNAWFWVSRESRHD
ncbi:AtpZ/AtpI family protein [Futiania mangrovi]|uniref:AtpZ/AtpI family protein n=1 Tax=Futiania mangrovi TaxID=2959716 RepID=A0A9J6PB08_9PROT|nr:AtpZ/AtpI family protein [Futiania mangrovii]MCP1335302.1 AtpZ/AtpI family protein [Futiania mangrovii]